MRVLAINIEHKLNIEQNLMQKAKHQMSRVEPNHRNLNLDFK